MAEQLFIRILNMSLTGSFVILAVLAIRILLKKAPRIFSYCLWAVVLFRLLCPISFSAAFSPFNALSSPTVEHGMIEYIPQDAIQPAQLLPPQDEPAAPVVKQGGTDNADAGRAATDPIEYPTVSLLQITVTIWLCGILLMAFYSIFMLVRLKRHLRRAVWEKDNIYSTNAISTPFVIGMVHPRIYLPASLEEHEREYVLLHEQIHIKRFDHIVKIIAFITLCIHWFNPFVWAAFFLSGKDMEMSCDEAVIRRIGSRRKKEYSASLLSMATGRRIVSGVPLAFGEGDTGSRIKNVLRYKKPAIFGVAAAAIICMATAIILLANPQESGSADNSLASKIQALFHSPSGEPDGTENNGSPRVYYGVVTEYTANNTTWNILMIPGLDDMDIPAAESISTYFEREEQELLPGDLVEITFPAGEELSILEVYPARFSASAESIVVKWSGFTLQRTNADTYRLTFPSGAFPELSGAKAGDMLSFYYEEPEEPAFATSPSESENSGLIATAPILAAGENEYGGPILTLDLSTAQIKDIFSGFGLYIRFLLEPADETYAVGVRSIARSARVIDSFVSDYDIPYDQGGELAFSQDCVFKVNYSMSGIDYRDVSFDVFADFINEDSVQRSKPCLLTFKDGLITEAKLQNAYEQYGINYSEFSLSDYTYTYNYLSEREGEEAFAKYYTLVSSETLDIADCAGSELIEVYTGDIGDGDGESGIVMFKDAVGNLLGIQDAVMARVGWNNVYLGEKEGTPFIMNVHIEDRWDNGVYCYWVYRLDENGGIKQIAGSAFNFAFPQGEYPITYDDAIFKEWVNDMTAWLEDCHLILSTQDGELRTEKISEADKYNYETLNLKNREKELGL
ncbi:MAG: M56 family metallopeptidase [Bacteroidales bacterium]|nr:M56 family metallopeptidase [Lachnoclostridium sp.]MCM1383510.1 M56 family metallopeptidase [Lachnoclostridium sp.]MCM1464207.1 M56 family metallopeptidase [Bacteroidales bacterium]